MGKGLLRVVENEGKFCGFTECHIPDVVNDARPLAQLSAGEHNLMVQGKKRSLRGYKSSVIISCVFEVLSPLVIFAASFGALHLGFNPNAMSQFCNILPGLDIYNLVSILGGSVAGAYIASPLTRLIAKNAKKRFNNTLEAVKGANDNTADFITKLSDVSGIEDFKDGFKITYFKTNVLGKAGQFPCGPQTERPVTIMDVLKIESIKSGDAETKAIYLYAVRGYIKNGKFIENQEKGNVYAFRWDDSLALLGFSEDSIEAQIINDELKKSSAGGEGLVILGEVLPVDVDKLASQYTPGIHSVTEMGPIIVNASKKILKRKK